MTKLSKKAQRARGNSVTETISIHPPQPVTVTLPNGEQEVLNVGDSIVENLDGTHEVLRGGDKD
jgi:hypothetical protein